MKLTAVILVVIALFWAWERHHRIANEKALAAVAGQLAGRDVGVECQGFFSALIDVKNRAGDVEFPNGRAPDHTFLTRTTCRTLERFRKASTHAELDCLLSVDWSSWRIQTDFRSACSDGARSTAQAINTLAHEAMHLRGFVSESAAQCYAIQEDAWTVLQLGGTREQGDALASFVLAQQPALPSNYQSSECRARGQLDLHPETPEFPTEAAPDVPPPELRGPALGNS